MLGQLGMIVKWAILLPVLIVVVLLAVANDQTVTVHLNPFSTDDPMLRVELPLYQLAFLIFVVGALVGALVAWRGQQRRRARVRREAALLRDSERAEQGRGAAPSGASGLLPRPERA